MPPLLIVILLVGLGTYLIRALSLVMGSHIAWPEWAQSWLSFVTPAVLGALLGPLLLTPGAHWSLPWHNSALLAAIPTAGIAWYSRNLLLTVLVGVVAFALLGLVVTP